jgi:RNA polymerase sigma factor (sigma-70 family)
MRNLTHPTRPVDGNADDMALLRRYVEYGSQEAFSELVSRHLPWVYGTCRKALQDKHMAEDAAQAVFIILARRAESITPATRLSGWLFNTARFVVKDAKKQETRYRRRETVAREMAVVRMTPGKAPVDAQTQATLDAAMATLTERDRLALLMHFYEGLSLAEMAEALGISKDGAKKRVARALTRLRGRLGRNAGSVVTVAALALTLRSTAARAATPIGLGDTIVTTALLPGRAGLAAQLMADGAMSAAAGASHRLLKALLASELAVAVALVGAWTMPSLTREASPAAAGGAGVAGQLDRSAGGPGVVAVARPVLAPDVDAPVGPRPARGWFGGAGDGGEAPYRSGADDPAADASPLAPYKRPVMLSIGDAGPASTGGGGGGSGDGGPGSTYAGLEPVRRSYPLAAGGSGGELTVAERSAIARATADALTWRWGGGSGRSGGGGGRGGHGSHGDVAAGNRPVLPNDLVPVVVGPGPGAEPVNGGVVPHNDGWSDFFDWFCPDGDGAADGPPPDFPAGDPLEMPIPGDPERAKRIARRLGRMFVEDGDGQAYVPWGRKRGLGGMKPYAVVAGADGDYTIVGGKPIPIAWLKLWEKYAQAGGGGSCGAEDECPFTGPRLHGPGDGAAAGASPLGPLDAQQAPEPAGAVLGAVFLAGAVLRRRRRAR